MLASGHSNFRLECNIFNISLKTYCRVNKISPFPQILRWLNIRLASKLSPDLY